MIDILRYASIIALGFSAFFMMGVMSLAKRLTTIPYFLFGTGLAYILLCFGTAIELSLRLGTPATWRTPIAVAAATVSLVNTTYAYFKWSREADDDR